MRCYNGCIPDSDYIARYGISQYKVERLRKEHSDLHVTYFPMERVYICCLRGSCWDVSSPRATYVEALLEGIANKHAPRTNLVPLRCGGGCECEASDTPRTEAWVAPQFKNWSEMAKEELEWEAQRAMKRELATVTAERDALREALELMVACANCLGWGNAEIENAETVLAAIDAAKEVRSE